MGEVWRVEDLELRREVAMKVVAARHPSDEDRLQALFLEEARITAALQHPAIVPVYELGHLPDGRRFFTMKVVEGRSLDQVFRQLQSASRRAGAWTSVEGWTFRGAVEAVARVLDALGFAHARGVIHQDVKPGNVMTAGYGEVLLLDWGIARWTRGEPRVSLAVDAARGDGQTRWGEAPGSPGFLAPEQVAGPASPVFGEIGPPTDVFAAGATLYSLCCGAPPWPDAAALREGLARGLRPPWRPIQPVPEEMVALVERALAPDPADRFADGGAFGRALGAWLDGDRRRDQALDRVAEALSLQGEVEAQRSQAARLRAAAAERLRALSPAAPAPEKAPAWAQEDEAARVEQQARQDETQALQLLRAALVDVPDLPEAHSRLADHYLALHRAAEARGESAEATEYAALLESHDAFSGRHAVYRSGRGSLRITLEADEVEVVLSRYRPRGRRLVPEPLRTLRGGPTVELALEMGSYLLELSAPGHHPMRYPVSIGRNERWDATPPGRQEGRPLRLLPAGGLGDQERFIPAGWFQAGTARRTEHEGGQARVWVDDLVFDAHPVTNTEYIGFLDDLVARGEEARALGHAPRTDKVGGRGGELLYGRRPDGGFCLVPDPDGDLWEPDWPVFMVGWSDAMAYAAWKAGRSGLPYRLPWELEWEKAARGVDGRLYPWGDHAEPAFANMRESAGGTPAPRAVSETPLDVGPYGVFGMAGGVMDWCQDRYREQGPLVTTDGAMDTTPVVEAELRAARGGAWPLRMQHCTTVSRWMRRVSDRRVDSGFRLCRTPPPPSAG